MPKFDVTGPNGRTVTLEGDGPPTEQELEEIFGQLDQGTSGPVDAPPSLFGRTMDVVGRVGSTLGRFGSATAAVAKEGVEAAQQGQGLGDFLKDAGGAVMDTFTPEGGLGKWKRNTDFDEVLGQAGMEEGWTRAGLGLAGDIVLDPTFVFSAPTTAVRKGVGLVGKGVDKVVDSSKALQTVKKGLQQTFTGPDFSHIVDTTTGATRGLDYGDIKRLGASSVRASGEHAQALAEDFFSKISPEKRKMFAHAIDKGVSTGDTQLDALLPKWRTIMDDLHAKQVEMGLLEPDQKIDNYIQYLTRSGRPAEAAVGSATRAVPASANKRQAFKTLEDAVKLGGATDDAQEILAASVAQVEKARSTEDFLKGVRMSFGQYHNAPGMRKLEPGRLKVGKKMQALLTDVYVPEELADDLERAVVLWEQPNELDNLYTSAMKIWKGAATSVNPGHHATNFLGNVHNMYVGGMDVKDIGRWLPATMNYARKAKFGENVIPTVAGYSSDELMKLANKYEILGSSSILGETVARGPLEKIANNRVFTATRKAGTEVVEEPARLAFWLNRIEKGDTPAQAAIKTKNVLFDYAELTDREKMLRNSGLVPFYTWMRKNIPFQIQQLGQNPFRVERVRNLAEVPWNATQSETDQTILPEQLTDAGYVPSPAAGPDGQPLLQRVNLPSNDLNKLGSTSMIGEALGPLPKFVIEGVMGEKFFGGPVEKRTGLTAPAPAAALLGLGLNKVLPESMQGYVTPKSTAMGPRQHDTLSWLMNTLMPTGFYGSTAKLALEDSPQDPRINSGLETLMRIFGMSPSVISGEDQKFEADRRLEEWKRRQTRKVILEP